MKHAVEQAAPRGAAACLTQRRAFLARYEALLAAGSPPIPHRFDARASAGE